MLLNAAMLMERQKHSQAQPYESTTERQGYANGFKNKTVQTRMGALTGAVPPQSDLGTPGRDGGFYLASLEQGLCSERAFKLALAEMYVQGVRTRKVAAIPLPLPTENPFQIKPTDFRAELTAFDWTSGREIWHKPCAYGARPIALDGIILYNGQDLNRDFANTTPKGALELYIGNISDSVRLPCIMDNGSK